MALAVLASEWTSGEVLALIVDHGLRAGSAVEADETRDRLTLLGIKSRILTLASLAPGPGLAARARTARLASLVAATREAGMVHLLLGHHAGDQAETLLMRRRAGSGPAGRAGMAAMREVADVRILRPLLHLPAAALRDLLRQRGIGWIEDPSNQDLRTERARLRAELADGAAMPALLEECAAAGAERAAMDRHVAAVLADRAMISPLGFAMLSPGPIEPAALSALWWSLSGRAYPPPTDSIARLAAAPRPSTLAGLRLLPAGRLGPGWLLVREALSHQVAATNGATWDRFTLRAVSLPTGLRIGPLGAHAVHIGRGTWPACIRQVLPTLFAGNAPVAVSMLDWGAPGAPAAEFRFTPAVVAAGAPWCGV